MGTTHLVPVVLLVGEHQKAPVIDEDTDEVLGKESSVTHPVAVPRARQDRQGGGRRAVRQGGQHGVPKPGGCSGASWCQEHLRWLQGAGTTTHPGEFNSPLSTVQGAALGASSLQGGLGAGLALGAAGGQRGQGGQGTGSPPSHPLPAIPRCPHPCPPPTLLLASQSISQLVEGSHCQPKPGQRDRLAGPSPRPRAVLPDKRGHTGWCPQGMGTGIPSRVMGRAVLGVQPQQGHRHCVPAVLPQSRPQ